MLQLRPVCEHCGKSLPADDAEAMICSFECTFCADCVNDILYNVCPNCGGGFEQRPVRTDEMLAQYPPTKLKIHNPVKPEQFKAILSRYKYIPPSKR